jgi:chemotaxis protein MotC
LKPKASLVWFAAALVIAATAGIASAASSLRLRDTMRTIERLQDGTVVGETESTELISRLMVQMETDISVASVSQLQDPKDVRAIVLFLLSGGNPICVEKAYRRVKIDPAIGNLISGAIAYAHGDSGKASELLMSISVDTMPANIAGRLALIQGILVADSNPEKAIEFFDLASAIVPGTIVEEGALRRCVVLASKLGKRAKFEQCSSRIIRYFSKSIYWKEFLGAFTRFAATISGTYDSFYSSWLLPAVEGGSDVEQVDVLLEIARIATYIGNFQLAILCASRVTQISGSGSVAQNRAILYSGAAMLGTRLTRVGAARLKDVDAAKLDQPDRDLLAKAQNIVAQIGVGSLGADVVSDAAYYRDVAAEETKFNRLVEDAKQALEASPSGDQGVSP